MHFLRTLVSVIVGFIAGSVINMGLVTLGPKLIPPPAGVDVTKPDSLAASMHLLEPKHYLFPFLAHAIGTFAGALVAYLALGGGRTAASYVIGVLFLAGGIAACLALPGAPVWFKTLDLVAAYLPMAWLATQIGRKLKPGVTDVPPSISPNA